MYKKLHGKGGRRMAKRILVVDDEEDIRKAVKVTLVINGFEVDTAKNLDECMEKLKRRKPDLVLLDILMRKVVGVSALQSIKESFPETKIIVFSVIESEDFKRKCLELGAVDYITKPFDNEDLVRRVKKALGVQGGES
jgi:DNA-binding response OmpR family regulator